MARKSDLTLEKLGISKRIGKIEVHIAEDRIIKDRLLTMLENHDKILCGSNSTPGLKVEVDRINQIEKNRRWHIRAIWAAIVGFVVKLVGDHFGKP